MRVDQALVRRPGREARRSGARTPRPRAARSPAPGGGAAPRGRRGTARAPCPARGPCPRRRPRTRARARGEHAAEVDDEGDSACGAHGRAGYPGRRGDRPSRTRAWFARARRRRSTPPLAFERISGGRSNLTYAVADAAGGRWALRRPPLGKRLASAHDMGREHRIISALQDTDVPVAARGRPLRGRAVNGARSTSWTSSRARSCARSRRPSAFPDEAERRAIGERVVDTLVAIHAVDPDAGRARRAGEEGGLRRPPAAPLAGPVGEVSRRASCRWSTRSTTGSPARIPEQGPATIVHGDYRLDNMILTDAGEVARGGRLGAVHARRPARRRRPAARLLGRGRRRAEPLLEPATTAPRASRARRGRRPLRRALGPRPLRDRLLRRPRPVEAGDHPRGRLRPLPAGQYGKPRTPAPSVQRCRAPRSRRAGRGRGRMAERTGSTEPRRAPTPCRTGPPGSMGSRRPPWRACSSIAAWPRSWSGTDVRRGARLRGAARRSASAAFAASC